MSQIHDIKGMSIDYKRDDTIASPRRSAMIEKEIHDLFIAAREEVFEDGLESNFTKSLARLIAKYHKRAIDVLTSMLLADDVNTEVASEALRLVGRIVSPSTHLSRLWLLERCLLHPSARIRDGAILGLAYLDDPRSIPFLQEALEREQIPELRDDIHHVISELEQTR